MYNIVVKKLYNTVDRILQLTTTQQGIYFDCLKDDPTSYNLFGSVLIENLHEVHFENAFKILIAEQAMLRSSLQIVNDFPSLLIHNQISFSLEKEVIENLSAEKEEKIQRIIAEEIKKPFDLSAPPLFRAKLLTLGDNKHLFLLCVHHLIADGLSFNIILNKLFSYHNKLLNKQAIRLKQDDGFRLFAEEENFNLSSGKYDKQKEYWANKLKSLQPVTLKKDFPVQSVGGVGKECRFKIPDNLIEAIENLATDQEVTTFMLFMAAFSVLLSHYTESEEVVLASPFSYRPDLDYFETVGCFFNMLFMQLIIPRKNSFADTLQKVAQEIVGAYKNIQYPNNLLLRDNLSLATHDTSEIFDITFVYDVYEEFKEGELTAEIISQDQVTFPGSLMVVLNKMPNETWLKIQYKSELYKETTIQLLGTRFLELLNYIVTDKNILIQDIDLGISDVEKLIPVQGTQHEKSSPQPTTLLNNYLVEQITNVWKEVLGIDQVKLDDNFFDVGGNSLSLIKVNNKLKKEKLDLPIKIHFQLPTIRLLAGHFSNSSQEKIEPVKKIVNQQEKTNKDIAIIGLSVNVPGAQTIQEFWHNLKNEKESIHFYKDEELIELGIDDHLINSPNYVKAVGRLDGIEFFDPEFFEYPPAEINLMSPQLRILYPGLWHAFEDAGYYPNSDASRIGLYISGSDDFEWYKNKILTENNYSLKYQAFTLSTNHFLATRLAYKLDIKGPAFTALSGCSSTLLNVHLGCQSLQLGECDLAIAGGITVELPMEGGYLYEEGMMFSPDGHCRPFDAKAAGTFFSNGMAFVVLKRFEDALKDGDHIYTVIKGSALNNDGAQKLGFTAPSSIGQAGAISEAYRVAGINPETISYVEAHGTGTSMGDPIEVESLKQAFATPKKQFCMLGSVKGNIGHPDTAAGVVGLVKVALSLEHKYIPGTVNYETPNPEIDFENSPFKVSAHGTNWLNPDLDGLPLRAGINSFGVGGTNAHMVLEESPTTPKTGAAAFANLLVFSAQSAAALTETAKKILDFVYENKGINLSDVAWTLQVGRKSFSHRMSFVLTNDFWHSTQEAIHQKINQTRSYQIKGENKKIVFMFCGQGSQYQGMARDLYFSKDNDGMTSRFKKYFDQVIKLLPTNEQTFFLDLIFGEKDQQQINETEFAQFSIFAISYAIANMLMELGIKPSILLGHSIGEITAATVAGVFELKDAVEIVRLRGRLMQQQMSGVMLAVMADPKLVRQQLIPDVYLALENTTNSCVVGGHQEAIALFEKQCAELNWVTARVKTSHAFHTPMMAKAAEAFQQELTRYSLNEPNLPIISNITGLTVSQGLMSTSQYWSSHIVSPVNFSKSLEEVLKDEELILIEIGPSNILSSLCKQHSAKKAGHHCVNFVRHPKEGLNDIEYLYNKIGQLWCLGFHFDWSALHGDVKRYRLSLPTYVFDKVHFPIKLKNSLQQSNKQSETPRYQKILTDKTFVSNFDSITALIIESFKNVLGFDNVGLDEDFFALGGDSLKAISLASALHERIGIKINLKDIFEFTTPRNLANFLNEFSVEPVIHQITPVENRAFYPLSSAQNRMYTFFLLDKKNLAYNLPSATLIEGEVDIPRFQQALRKLIVRHESLRTRFEIQDNRPVQVIDNNCELPFKLSNSKASNDAQKMGLIYDFIKPFDLHTGPLFRAELVKLTANQYLFLFDIHHIVADGTSIEIIARDFNQLYVCDLAPLAIHYRDYAVWQDNLLKSEAMIKQRDFWLNYLSGDLPILEFPTDFERQAIRQTAGERIYFTLDPSITKQLVEYSKQMGTTLFMTLLAAWTVLVARYTDQDDIFVGVPVAGRTQKEILETVGMFVNMLLIRSRLDFKTTFSDFLAEVKTNVLNAFTHQEYQFDDLVHEINFKRDMSRHALFDACFDFQNMEFFDLQVENLKFTPYLFKPKTTVYDLVLTCQENKHEQNIQCYLDYSSALFKEETIERIFENFKTVLTSLLSHQDIAIGQIDLVSSEERKIICTQFNKPILKNQSALLVHEMFQYNAREFPDKIALILSSGKQLTYAELNRKANALAWHLLDLNYQTKNNLIGVMADRNEDLMIAILAIMKIGKAFVLIDPSLPKERIAYSLSQCELELLLTSTGQQHDIEFAGDCIDLNQLENDQQKDNPQSLGTQQDLAYVMFTSGSTGKPKGVMINQASLLNLINDIKIKNIFENPTDRIMCITTVSFDLFIIESLAPLCTGHSVYLTNEIEQLDPALATRKISEYNITHFASTVTRVNAFSQNTTFKQALKFLKCILTGAENFPLTLLKDLQKKTSAKIYNLYGPTEATVWTSGKELTQATAINVGKPIPNSQIYILNSMNKLQPIGVYGELCIAGEGLARGYLNNASATQEAFIELPELGMRVYRTGDRARFNSAGEIELLGRLDSQVKIRGYRVELGEIENIILKHDFISQVAVVPFQDHEQNKQLAVYYCVKNSEISSDKDWLKKWLKDQLPHYLMPSYLLQIETLPVLANGKVDKKALPLPKRSDDSSLKQPAQLSFTELEKQLLSFWRDVLSVEAINKQDNFFDLGGNSLGLIQINNKLSAILGDSVPLLQLFKYPTIESLAASLTSGNYLIRSERDFLPQNIDQLASSDIAVIGMAIKCPGSDTVDDFWDNIVSGRESITHFTRQELLQSGIHPELLENQNYVSAKGYLENAEYFDADFFNYSNYEANIMDPQARILHQCAWEVLENAGYDPSCYEDRIGLFAGSAANGLWLSSLLKDPHDFINAFEAITFNEKDFLTTRLSYKLNLTGPSINVQTACSTSLVAIHQAVQSLLHGECEMAIAGGVTLTHPRKEGYLWHEGMIFSRDGHCRPFDEDSSGIVPGNGCGLVLLKPLNAALRDKDHIYGIIKGSAINNDGVEKIGYTAPGIKGQSQVISAALQKAGMAAEDMSYLEAHGTGTSLGDPIEIEALRLAWKTDKRAFCAIGSIKANLGHLDAAAGVASFIKAILVLNKRQIPPQINFQVVNTKIDLPNSPFYITAEPIDIADSKQILRAGVSSFGIGGTNAHIVIEQPPVHPERILQENISILPFSSRCQESLLATSEKIVNYLQNQPAVNINDAAWTLQVGRKPFEYRKALIVQGSFTQLDSKYLESFLNSKSHKIKEIKKKIIYISDDLIYYQNLLNELNRVDYPNTIALLIKQRIENVLSYLPEVDQERFKAGDLQGNLKLFIVSYALATVVIDLGIVPDHIIGKGVGEIASLAVSGVFSLEAAMAIINKADSMLTNLEPGTLFAALNHPMASNITPELASIFSDYRLHNQKMLSQDDIKALLNDANNCLIATNSDEWLTSNFKLNSAMDREPEIFYLLPANHQQNGMLHLYQIIGAIWCRGVNINWRKLNHNSDLRRIPLPNYQFTKKAFNSDINLTHFSQPHSTVEASSRKTTTINQQLSLIWRDLFGLDEINLQANFFDLGGDSLKAVILAAHIQKNIGIEMPVEEIFKNATLEKMQAWLSSSHVAKGNCSQLLQDKKNNQTIQSRSNTGFYPASSAQKRLYAVHQLLGNSIPYNLIAAYHLHGRVDKGKLKQAFNDLVLRHESLRTRFDLLEGDVVQVIDDPTKTVIEFETCKAEFITENINSYFQAFDLLMGPLFKSKLITIEDNNHILLFDIHHIIADQSSVVILVKELADLYAGKSLPSLAMQYKDFAVWQNTFMKSIHYQRQVDYWRKDFEGELPLLNFPIDFTRPAIHQFDGQRISFKLDDDLTANINATAKCFTLTPYMIFMAALKLTLWKYTGQTDLIVGTATAGRRHADFQPLVGMFANTLAIRSQVNSELSLADYLQYIKNKLMNAFENQDCQLENLIELLNLEKDLSRNPLFSVVINYIDMGNHELMLEGLALTPYQALPVYSKFDFTFTIEKIFGGYIADVEFATSLFKPESMQQFISSLFTVLKLITDEPSKKLKEICLLDPAEIQSLVYDYNQTETAYPKDQSLIELFEDQVQKSQNNPALLWNHQTISYDRLNKEANKIAELLSLNEIKHGDKVAILLNRSPSQIICLLAILKCGAIYVPIDTTYPEARIEFILEDSGSSLLLTESNLELLVDYRIPRIFLDRALLELRDNTLSSFQSANFSSEDIAYIMYTSGSTGNPKGVLVSHRNITRLVKATNYIEFLPTDRVLQLSNFAFDGSVFDIYGALLNGACLVLIPQELILEISMLAVFIKQAAVTVCFFSTAFFNKLVELDVTALKQMRKILFGGEAASIQHVRTALDALGSEKLINVYGPTETTTFATYYPINSLNEDILHFPIGYPLSNVKLYCLDREGQSVPVGIPGELYIGGGGVARGYLNNPELTNQRFLPNRFEKQGLIYKTGDLVKRLPTGEIVYLGRSDFQIKIRGFRVELAEIETHIKKIPGVQSVVVRVKKDQHNNSEIIAFYTWVSALGPHANEIRNHLRKQLPNFMMPAQIIKLAAFPLNTNGKIDLKALDSIEKSPMYAVVDKQPRNNIEQLILNLMRKSLNNYDFGIHDDFFHYGGHSLKAITLVHEMAKNGINIKVSELFQNPTVARLALLVSTDILPSEQEGTLVKIDNSGEIRNEKDIANLLADIEFASTALTEKIKSLQIISEFPFSPIQTLHTNLAARLSGFTTSLKGYVDQAQVRYGLALIIHENQLLHCIMNTDSNPIWQEYDISGQINQVAECIPYLDLRDYEAKLRKNILDKIAKLVITSDYKSDSLSWRCCCLRLTDNLHSIIWGFDHISFDGMSADILRSRINWIANLTKMSGQFSGISPDQLYAQKYGDYVELLKQGPGEITEKEIIKMFYLENWQKKNTEIMNKIKHADINYDELNIVVPFSKYNVTDPWQFAFQFVVKILSRYFGTDEIPLSLIHYGRSYGHKAFYNCIGEFLDIIPLLVNENNLEMPLSTLLECCRIQGINFLALLFDGELSKKYQQINKLLLSSFETEEKLLPLILFNFQGFISKEDKSIIKNIMMDEKVSNKLALLPVTINYNESDLMISLPSLKNSSKNLEELALLLLENHQPVMVEYLEEI
jgi:amino acid adenylation domain-containing protein